MMTTMIRVGGDRDRSEKLSCQSRQFKGMRMMPMPSSLKYVHQNVSKPYLCFSLGTSRFFMKLPEARHSFPLFSHRAGHRMYLLFLPTLKQSMLRSWGLETQAAIWTLPRRAPSTSCNHRTHLQASARGQWLQTSPTASSTLTSHKVCPVW